MRRILTFLAFAPLLAAQCGKTTFNPSTGRLDCIGPGWPPSGTWCPSVSAGVFSWVTCPGASGGISSIGLTLPSWYTASPNPLTVNGVITISPATAQTSHLVLGTCGTGTSVSLCALTAGDIPALSYQAPLTAYSTISGLSGYPTTFPPVNTGNWAGTWQTYSPSSFQVAISNYSTISALTGYPSTFPPTNTGNWAGTWQSNSPSAFQAALSNYSTISGLTGYPTSFNAGQILGVTIPALAAGHLQYTGSALAWDTATYLTSVPASLPGTTSVNGTAIPASATLTQDIGSVSALALPTTALASAACTTVTSAVTGALATDTVYVSESASWKALAGYSGTSGMLTVYLPGYLTAGQYNLDVCNWTSSTISTIGAAYINVKVVR